MHAKLSLKLQCFQRYGEGPKICKVGHVIPSGLPLIYFFHFYVKAHLGLYACEI